MSNVPLRAIARAGALALVALAATTSTAIAAGEPTVTGGLRPFAAQSQSGPHNFLLRGKVAANAAAATTRIEYGATTAYGTSVNAATVSAGLEQEVTVTLPTPTAGSTVNYRTVATNSAGTTYGPNQVFTVPAGVVRPVYMYPTDRDLSVFTQADIRNAMAAIQAFYLGETGKTFTYAKMPISCELEEDSEYYGTVDGADGSWEKLEDALTECGVEWDDLYSDIIAFADIPTTCSGGNSSTGGGKGASPSNNLSAIAIMDDRHIQGLAGVSGIMDQCYGTPPAPTPSLAQGAEAWKSVIAHEIGHTFDLLHPYDANGACYGQSPTTLCNDALMQWGWIDPIGSTYLLSSEKTQLNSSPFIS